MPLLQEHRRVGQQLARQGYPDGVVAGAHPLPCRALLDFHPDGVHGHHEDEQHQHPGHERVVQVDRVVHPGVVQRVGVDDDGLQQGYRLVLRGALGQQGGLAHGGGGQLAHGLHVLEQQRPGDEQRVVGVERHGGLPLCLCVGSSALGDVEESVYLAPLHGLPCFVEGRVVCHNGGLLKGVEVACQLAGGGGLVLVHDARRHVCGKPRLHQRGEEHVAEQRRHYHAEQVERAAGEAAALARHHVPEGDVFLFSFFHAVMNVSVLPCCGNNTTPRCSANADPRCGKCAGVRTQASAGVRT